MNTRTILRSLLGLFLLVSTFATAQTPALNLVSGTYTFSSTDDIRTTITSTEASHCIIVFKEIPTNETKRKLEQAGIQLMDYLPRNAYFATVNGQSNFNVLNTEDLVVEIKPDFKLSSMLKRAEYPHWTLYGEGQIELIGSYFNNISLEALALQLAQQKVTIVNAMPNQRIQLRLDIEQLPALYAMNGFFFFEELSAPEEPEDLPGRTSHRSNSLWTEFNGGLEYDGSGVTVMMQDDGIIGPHIDFTGRIDQTNCNGCSTDPNDGHGDHVGGIIMGAGNLDPYARGMAHGAELLVYGSSNNNYASVPGLYTNNNMVITSKSYSAGCNAGYNGLTRDLDEQVRTMPSLTHVFSAGNAGTQDCGYGAGSGWGNITGGHKSGKNVIAVGNLTISDVVNSSSSRGPATDGRIKPDICGVGTSVLSCQSDNTYAALTGTSMSCPGVSGTIAQLYEGYRDLNSGNDPNSGLIKASILNTAEDLGNSGPDFIYGWGRLNARRAFELLSNNQYINGSISQGGNDSHTITVPSGTAELRVMVYWTDYQGSTSAATALVNDIDMTVSDPSAQVFQPWVLDPTPTVAALNSLAVPGADHLNNMEQVTIDNPAAGTYTIDLSGFSIPQGPQEYYIVYYTVRDEITVTYPIGGEGIAPGGTQIIRWDAPEGTDPFAVEYTTDDGATWNLIANASADSRQRNWSPPSLVSGQARVRVTRNGTSDQSDANFSIIRTPANLHVEWACPDSLNLAWTAVSGATGYEVSMLGSEYMDSIGTTSADNLTIPFPSTSEGWFSVRALGPNDARGERAIAINKQPGEFGCTWSTPSADFSKDCDNNSGTAYCLTFTNESTNVDASSSVVWYFPGGTPATSTDPSPQICYPTAGDYDVAMVVTNSAGSDSIYQSNAVHVSETSSLPYVEGFEDYSSFSNLDQWSLYNPDGNAAFQISNTVALSGNRSAVLNNYFQIGDFTDELISGPVDLSSLNANDTVTLSFRYSYRKKNSSNNELLRLMITKNCADGWVTRKTLIGNLLSDQTSLGPWFPQTPDDWTTVHVTNVTSTFFTGDFRFKFRFESNSGNSLFLDDINIYQGAPSDDLVNVSETELFVQDLTVFPNPTEDELNVSFALNASELADLSVYDLTGKKILGRSVIAAPGSNLVLLETSALSAGTYILKANIGDYVQQIRFVVR